MTLRERLRRTRTRIGVRRDRNRRGVGGTGRELLLLAEGRLAYFPSCLPRHVRVSIEFRHPSWHQEQTYGLLEQYAAAYCVMSGANLPCVLRATTDFAYVRRHGPDAHHLYGGS